MAALLWTTVALQASALVFGQTAVDSPSQCFTKPNIIELVTCLDTFAVQKSGYPNYPPETYQNAQPTPNQQLPDWSALITTLLDTDGECPSESSIPTSLNFYAIQEFQGNCVLYETTAPNHVFAKGWGTMIVPRSKSDVKRSLHFSAPSPGLERSTLQQAASLFQSTQSQSYFLPGRDLNASTLPSDCIEGTWITDVSHNNGQPFFPANVAIHEWQLKNGGCLAGSCAFLQFRGKARTTCPGDDIFLSAGIAKTAPSSLQSLAKALKDALPESWSITLPTDSNCSLIGSKNVVGRYLNGLNSQDVCIAPATTATGQFIQIEQAARARSPEYLNDWTAALLHAFPEKN